MPAATLPGEIWRVDLGLAAKVRPALILRDYPADDELALIVIIPHTMAVRGNRWDFPRDSRFSKRASFISSKSSQCRSRASIVGWDCCRRFSSSNCAAHSSVCSASKLDR